MENTNSKVLTVSFMIAGVLIGILVSVLLDTLSAVASGPVGHFVSQDLVRHGLPVLIGIVSYFFLQFNKTVVKWADESATELLKVVWPTRKETISMTVMVCIMLIVSGVFFGVLDVISGSVIDWLLHQTFFGLFS